MSSEAERPADDADGPAASGLQPSAALAQALRALLAPLARLALARGLTYATLDELLKQALVQQADAALAGQLPPHRRASRVTTTTGIHRREVTRLLQLLHDGCASQAPAQRSHAGELFTHWRSRAEYCDRRGSPRELPRCGPAPSFESLAQAVTRDVHPRSLLGELLRLGLAAHDEQRDSVRLLRETFVPAGDADGMLGTLGRNVGSHLQAAVDNLLIDHHRHFEQALYANGLSADSLKQAQALIEQQWHQLMDRMVPALEALIEQDAAAGTAPPPPAPRGRRPGRRPTPRGAALPAAPGPVRP